MCSEAEQREAGFRKEKVPAKFFQIETVYFSTRPFTRNAISCVFIKSRGIDTQEVSQNLLEDEPACLEEWPLPAKARATLSPSRLDSGLLRAGYGGPNVFSAGPSGPPGLHMDQMSLQGAAPINELQNCRPLLPNCSLSFN